MFVPGQKIVCINALHASPPLNKNETYTFIKYNGSGEFFVSVCNSLGAITEGWCVDRFAPAENVAPEIDKNLNEFLSIVYDVVTSPAPSTINMQAYDAEGNMILCSSQSSNNPVADAQAMGSFLELAYAAQRGVEIKPFLFHGLLIQSPQKKD